MIQSDYQELNAGHVWEFLKYADWTIVEKYTEEHNL